MLEFKKVAEIVSQQWDKMISQERTTVFATDADKEELWNLYLDSFPEGTNPIYRERREYDCSACKQFVRGLGHAVVIREGRLLSLWDIQIEDTTFQPVFNALSDYVKSKPITNEFYYESKTVGVKQNFEQTESGIKTWTHFYATLPKHLVISDSVRRNAKIGGTRDVRNVFKRSLDELTKESILTVIEISRQGSLYKGDEWIQNLELFLSYKNTYDRLVDSQAKELFAWSQNPGPVIGKIRNHSIGTLLIDLSEGVDLDAAVKKYEAVVAPSNYKRPKPIYTQKMLDAAKKTVEDLGFMDALPRRYANLDDITVNNILFANRDAAKVISRDIFGDMAKEAAINPKKFSKVEEIPMDKFLTDVLPAAKEVEIMLENKFAPSMVSLIAPVNSSAKTMFKWNNNFSWAYSGNMTDSLIKERVKSAGGDVEGVLRFSIQWNDGAAHHPDDLDAYCDEPGNFTIFFGRNNNPRTGGSLDVDIQHPTKGTPAVENITWPTTSRMEEGIYRFYVKNYANRGGKDGFRAEIEFDGQIYNFDYPKPIRTDEDVPVAEVIFSRNEGFSIKEQLPSALSSREIWNVKSHQFVPVSVIMNSPNYWDEQSGIGHKHYFFMLKDCINPERPNGFYNEFLKSELNEHKRVFEALGSKMAVEETENQLSGVGFSSTKRNEIIVKVTGQTERILRIKI